MTSYLKHLSGLGLGVAMTAALVQPGFALEGGGGTEATKPGAFIGASAGVPPPGIYMFNQVFTYQANLVGGAVNAGAGGFPGAVIHKQVWVDAQGFVFVPGWTFLGATYDAVIVQPWVSASLAPFNGGGPNQNGFSILGAFDTYIVPIELSWKFGDSGFQVKTGVGIYVPDGHIIGPNGTNSLGNPWWTFQPELILSYLKDGWNISVFLYDEFSTKNFQDGYQQGDVFHVDFNILKTWGKWTFGPVGYYVNQYTNDTPVAACAAGQLGCNAANGGAQSRFAVGGFVGYDFGGASVSVWGTDEVWQQTSCGGINCPVLGATGNTGFTIFGTLSYRLWAPDEPIAPKRPLIYK